MKPLHIRTVKTIQDRHAFLSLPWRVYKDDPYWVPPLFSERMEFVDPEHQKFFEHAEVEFFLARRGESSSSSGQGEVVGSIAAFTNHRHNQFQDENVGFFGFFEVLDDPEAARVLLETAENWVRERGHDSIRGPAQFSTNEECGLLVDGFDDRPRILMTYNPRRYMDYIKQAGYEKAMDLWAWAINLDILEGGEKFPDKLARVVEKVKQRGHIHIRKIKMKEFDIEVERVKKLYNTSWAKNWGFVPMTDAEIGKISEELRPIIDTDLVFIAEVDSKPAGFSLTLLDMNEPLRLAYPKPDTPEWWTLSKFAWHWKVRRRISWVRVFALGVLPEYRALGIDALFYYHTALEAMKKGIQFAEMSWILENNDMMNRAIELMGAKIYKTYRFYEKAL
ncbi:MAG: N-acetyltransferase [Chloroflexota bacterium]|nr:N-acetyltransferase [Chloroflexota bacterium]